MNVKHGKKPTVSQRKFIKQRGLIPENWLIVKDTPTEMHLVHRHSDSTKRIILKGE